MLPNLFSVSKIVHALRNCPNLFFVSKFVLKIQKMFVLLENIYVQILFSIWIFCSLNSINVRDFKFLFKKMFFSFINMFSRFKKCSCFKKLSKFVLCFKICSQYSKIVRASKFVLHFKICSQDQKKCPCLKKCSYSNFGSRFQNFVF